MGGCFVDIMGNFNTSFKRRHQTHDFEKELPVISAKLLWKIEDE